MARDVLIEATQVMTTTTLPDGAAFEALGLVFGWGRAQGVFGNVATARKQALEEIRKAAGELQADAVIAAQVVMSENASGTSVQIVGTAVKRLTPR
jgi:uncharacterized protein YbjQ (UPF0145 family)